MKLKLKELLIILGVLVLLIGGYWLYQQGYFNKFKTAEDEAAWRLQQEQNVAQLIRAGNFDACGKVDYKSVDGTDYKIICQNNIALNKANETSDLAWCEKLDDKFIKKDDCQRQVIYQKLGQNNDLVVCDSAPIAIQAECRDSFWFKEAVQKNNIELCVKISSDSNRELCRDNFYKEKLIQSPANFDCSVFSDFSKSDCENFQKVKTGKISINNISVVCDQLFDPRLGKACLFNQ